MYFVATWFKLNLIMLYLFIYFLIPFLVPFFFLVFCSKYDKIFYVIKSKSRISHFLHFALQALNNNR